MHIRGPAISDSRSARWRLVGVPLAAVLALSALLLSAQAVGAVPTGTIYSEHGGSTVDGQTFEAGKTYHFETGVQGVVSEGMTLRLVVDGSGPGGIGPAGEDVCDALFGDAQCVDIIADLATTFGDGDTVVIDDDLTIASDAPVGEWTLNYYLVEHPFTPGDSAFAVASFTFYVAKIAAPQPGEIFYVVPGGSVDVDLAAMYPDNSGDLRWAVRHDTCDQGTNTVAGNVDGHNDPYTWVGGNFSATVSLGADQYCLVTNPTSGERLTREFEVRELATITASQELEFNPVGVEHEVTVTVEDDQEEPAEGVHVLLFLDNTPDPDTLLDEGDTDAGGQVVLSYTSSEEGVHTLYACVDLNDDDACDEGLTSNSLIKTWLENFVTGGAKLGERKADWTFAGTVGVLEGEGIVGQFQFVDHTGRGARACHLDTFTSLEFSGDDAESPPASNNTATFTGSGDCNNGESVTVTVTIQDLGEPGKDVDHIEATGGIQIPDGTIDGGNFQVHDIE